jgi:hypothetical protein
MKIKLIKRKDELIIEHFKLKDSNSLRYDVLKYVLDNISQEVVLFIDTNINKGNEKVANDSIEMIVSKFCDEYEIRKITETGRKLFGISSLFNNKKKPQKTERIIVVKLKKEKLQRSFYDQMLKYYDYGIGIGATMSASQLCCLYCDEYEEILFNKNVLKKTIYDSVLFSRVRADFIDEKFEKFFGYTLL